MVEQSVLVALKCVEPLKLGQTPAPESPPREDVPDAVVDRTLAHLFPTIAAMVQVQRLAAMRPNEVCRMRVADLDRSGEIWIYRPIKHKGTWRGHGKAVALGKQEQEIIGPRLIDKGPEYAVFSPKDTIREKKERDAANRKTPVQPSQRERAQKRAANPKCRAKDFYTSGSYAAAIKRSIEIANRTLDEPIPHWTPYQLRHAAATEIVATDGIDVARAVLGQTSIKVTQRYNHADLKIAIEQAGKRGKKKKAE